MIVCSGYFTSVSSLNVITCLSGPHKLRYIRMGGRGSGMQGVGGMWDLKSMEKLHGPTDKLFAAEGIYSRTYTSTVCYEIHEILPKNGLPTHRNPTSMPNQPTAHHQQHRCWTSKNKRAKCRIFNT